MHEVLRPFEIGKASDHSKHHYRRNQQNFFKDLNPDKSLDTKFSMLGPSDPKHLKDSPADVDQVFARYRNLCLSRSDETTQTTQSKTV